MINPRDNAEIHALLKTRGLWATWHNHTDRWVLSTALPGPIQIVGPDFRNLFELWEFVQTNDLRKGV